MENSSDSTEIFSSRFKTIYVFFLIMVCLTVVFGTTVYNMRQTEKKFAAQYRHYNRLQEEFNQHPVTRWKQQIVHNEKTITVLEKQLRDMARFYNQEEIDRLKLENEELRRQIEEKREEWEALKERLNDAKEELESIKKRMYPNRAEAIIKEQGG